VNTPGRQPRINALRDTKLSRDNLLQIVHHYQLTVHSEFTNNLNEYRYIKRTVHKIFCLCFFRNGLLPGAYLGFCRGGCTFLADLPLPPCYFSNVALHNQLFRLGRGGCTGEGGGMHVHPVHPPWVRPWLLPCPLLSI
jgi:hypothetical protein